jgi:hypothetical protein
MILTAHQPVYLPWLGLFHKIALADRFCIFDIAQYQTKDYNNRNRIKTHTDSIWLSVPVESKNHLQKRICDVKIVSDGWNKKHIRSIRHSYQKAPFFDEYIEIFEDYLLGRDHVFLSDLNTGMLSMLLGILGITVPLVKASDHEFVGKKSDLVLDMCIKLGASEYIFGEQGKDYADVKSFADNDIRAFFQKYNHPVYPQINGPFLPFLSVIDLLFNVGPASREILLSGNAASVTELDDGQNGPVSP